MLGRAAGQAVLNDDAYFLGHLFTFPPSIMLHRAVALPCDHEQRGGQAPAELPAAPSQTCGVSGVPCSSSHRPPGLHASYYPHARAARPGAGSLGSGDVASLGPSLRP